MEMSFFDQAFNNSFHQRLESINHNATLAIIGTVREPYKEKLYQELDFKSLQSRRWFQNYLSFIKQ